MLTIAAGVFVGGLALVVLGPLVLAIAWAILMIPFWILGGLFKLIEPLETPVVPRASLQHRQTWREWHLKRGEKIPEQCKLPGDR